MAIRNHLKVCSVILLVLLAGCSGAETSTTTGSPASSPTTEPGTATTGTTVSEPTTSTVTNDSVPVLRGSVPITPDRQFERVENLTGTDVSPPERIEFRDPDTFPIGNGGDPTTFQRHLGFESTERNIRAYVNSSNVVVVNESLKSRPIDLEMTLAHEYYHVIQQRGGAFDDVWDDVDDRPLDGGGYDGSSARWAIIEGSADYVQQRYWEAYVDGGESPAAKMNRTYRESSPTTKLFRGRYYYGYRYVDTKVDSARNLSRVFEAAPRTTEQLIHGLPSGSEPPADLDVNVDRSSRWTANDRDRMGELFVRHALHVGLDASAARTGADGWGNDRRIEFRNSSTDAYGYVWVLKWDDPANASEFEAAFGRNLDAWASPEGTRWETENGTIRTKRVDDETVAVVIGPRSFVRTALIGTSDGSVVVSWR